MFSIRKIFLRNEDGCVAASEAGVFHISSPHTNNSPTLRLSAGAIRSNSSSRRKKKASTCCQKRIYLEVNNKGFMDRNVVEEAGFVS